jgi:hypothetical protein
MCVQSRFAGLRPRSRVVIALNRRGFVPFVVVYEQVAGYGCCTDSALDEVSVLLSWATSAVDVLLTTGHSEERAAVIVVLEFFSFVVGGVQVQQLMMLMSEVI